MKFRITEPVFFFGKQREPGEIMEAPMGPYRQQVEPGGLRNVAQFVEIPRELPRVSPAPVQGIRMSDQTTETTTAEQVGNISIAPAASAAAKPTPLALRVRALTGRFAKFQDTAGALLGDGEKAMNTLETDGPGILTRATQSMQDGVTAITDLGDSLKALDRTANGA